MVASEQAGRSRTCSSGPPTRRASSAPAGHAPRDRSRCTTPTSRPGAPPEGAGTTQYDVPFRSTYMDVPNSPLFSFGQGLSYSSFAYSDLKVLTPVVPLDGIVRAGAVIQNTGDRAGEEIVQLYVRDVVVFGHAAGQGTEGVPASRSGCRRGARGGIRGIRCRNWVATVSICAIRRTRPLQGVDRPGLDVRSGRRVRGVRCN